MAQVTRIKSYTNRVTADLASLHINVDEAETRAIVFACRHDIKPSAITAAILDGRGVEVKFSQDLNAADFKRCQEYIRCAKLSVEELMSEVFSHH